MIILNTFAKAAILLRFMFVIFPDSQRETVPSLTPVSYTHLMLVADNELHRTNIERECLPAIAEAFNVTNIRVVTQGLSLIHI